MAITHTQVQVEWGGSDTQSVSAGGDEESDDIELDVTCFSARIMVKADNASTPASGDEVEVRWVESMGDPDADPDSTDEFTVNGVLLGILDTNADDPAIESFQLPIPQDKAKLRCVSRAASNSITVSAEIVEQRG